MSAKVYNSIATERINRLANLSNEYVDLTGKNNFNPDSKDFKFFNRIELKKVRSTVIGFSDKKLYNLKIKNYFEKLTNKAIEEFIHG